MPGEITCSSGSLEVGACGVGSWCLALESAVLFDPTRADMDRKGPNIGKVGSKMDADHRRS
jgi:hypothetical protein